MASIIRVKRSTGNAAPSTINYGELAVTIANGTQGNKGGRLFVGDNTKGLYAGVPVIIGSEGVEKVVELELDKEEKENFKNSIKSVQDLFNAAQKIDPSLK